MDSNSYQSLTEAYQSIYSSQENLEEQGGYLGFSVGRGKKSVTGSYTDKSGNTFGGEAGQVQSKDTDAAAKATTTNALSKLQDTQRKSSTAPKPATSLASKTSSVKPGATGASALGGPLSLSAADKAPRTAAGPKIDKVPEVQTKKANYFIPNVQLAKPVDKNAPTKVDPTSAKPKPKPNKTNTTPRPTDKAATPTPTPTPTPRSTPTPTPTPTPRSTPTPTPTPRVANTTPTTPRVSPTPRVANTTQMRPTVASAPTVDRNRQRQVASYEMDAYNLVLEYLLDEGFASTEQSADKIILNMSEAWFSDIMELTGGKGHPGYKAGSKDHGDLEDHPAAGKKGGVLSPRYGNHLGDMDDEDEDEDDLESVVKQQSRDRRETVRKPLRDKVKAARKKMTKEEAEYVDENRRAARSAGASKDDSKKQTDPSKDGFTGIGNMTIKDIMALNKKIEARKAKIDEGREEDAKKSLDAVKKRQGVLDDHEKKTGKKLDITKTPEYKSHKQNFPGAKRTGKKERGAKETPDETHRRRVNKTVDRIVKKGYTSKEKKEVESMAKHTSPRD